MIAVPRIGAVAVSLALLAIAGCGGSDESERLLPQRVADELELRLESIRGRVEDGSAGACEDIYRSRDDGGDLEPIDEALASIPENVDPQIRAALEQSFQRLEQLVADECGEIREREPDEQDSAPEETEPDTDVEPPETDTTETDPDDPAEPERTQPPPDGEPAPPQDPGRDGGQGGGRGPTGDGPPGQDGGDTEGGGVEAPEGD